MGKFMVKKGENGYFFNLVADNHEVIAASQLYSTREACLKGVNSVSDNASDAKVEDQTVKNYEKQGNPKFEVFTDETGEFRFNLKAGNGKIIASSSGYKSKSGCMNGIRSVKDNTFWSEVEEKKEEK